MIVSQLEQSPLSDNEPKSFLDLSKSFASHLSGNYSEIFSELEKACYQSRQLIGAIEIKYPNLYIISDDGYGQERLRGVVDPKDEEEIENLKKFQKAVDGSKNNDFFIKLLESMDLDSRYISTLLERVGKEIDVDWQATVSVCFKNDDVRINFDRWLRKNNLSPDALEDSNCWFGRVSAMQYLVSDEAKDINKVQAFGTVTLDGVTYTIWREPGQKFRIDIPYLDEGTVTKATEGHLHYKIYNRLSDGKQCMQVSISSSVSRRIGEAARTGQRYCERGLSIARKIAEDHGYYLEIECANPIAVHALWKVFPDLLPEEEPRVGESPVPKILYKEVFDFTRKNQ